MSTHPGPGAVPVWPGSRRCRASRCPPCPQLVVSAALGSAAWSWHRNWFGRFCHTHEQWEGWELGRGRPEEAELPCLPIPTSPLPVPASPLPALTPFSREVMWGAGKQKPLLVLARLPTWQVTMNEPLSLWPQCLYLYSGALGSVILKQPCTMILVRALPFALHLRTSHSMPSASGSEWVK